ncbi:MAG: nucleotidyltransferase [Acidimicrobiales bacterium]
MSNHYPDSDPPTEASLIATLNDVVEALREDGVDHLLMGGIGAYSHARPRVTEDIDVFIRPGDVERVRRALEGAGFDVVDHDPMWLVKAWKRGVLVDVIFRSSGGIYLDDEMLRRQWCGEYKGVLTPLIAPEDLLVIKALTAAEANPQHWYDAMAIISRCELDWDYLLQRARQAGPRRVLSLLLFAESSDLVVPSTAVQSLFDAVHPHREVAR